MIRERDITGFIKPNDMELKSLDFKVGQTYRSHVLNENDTYKIYIEAIIPSANGSNNMIVFRYYGKHKQYWHYAVELDWCVTRCIEWAEEEKKNKIKSNEQN